MNACEQSMRGPGINLASGDASLGVIVLDVLQRDLSMCASHHVPGHLSYPAAADRRLAWDEPASARAFECSTRCFMLTSILLCD